MPWDWLNFRDPLKVNNPSEHGKNDAEHGEASSPPKAQWIDRLVGDGPAFDAAQEKYEKSYNERKAELREEQNNEYLRQIAENTKRR